MAERLLQARFNEGGSLLSPLDVTPAGFTQLPILTRRHQWADLNAGSDLGRFVREVREPVQIGSPEAAAAYLQQHLFTPFEIFDQEELWVLLLNTKNRITHEALVYRGTVNSMVIRPAELFKAAVRVNAAALILAHNHPSGSPEPSPEDVQVTRAANQAGSLLGIELLDHLIVGRDTWVSLKTRELGFEETG